MVKSAAAAATSKAMVQSTDRRMQLLILLCLFVPWTVLATLVHFDLAKFVASLQLERMIAASVSADLVGLLVALSSPHVFYLIVWVGCAISMYILALAQL